LAVSPKGWHARLIFEPNAIFSEPFDRPATGLSLHVSCVEHERERGVVHSDLQNDVAINRLEGMNTSPTATVCVRVNGVTDAAWYQSLSFFLAMRLFVTIGVFGSQFSGS
jgi:hypothetical protein